MKVLLVWNEMGGGVIDDRIYVCLNYNLKEITVHKVICGFMLTYNQKPNCNVSL